MSLRFNDLIATVLAARTDGSVTRVILWRQCVDLLAQFDCGGSDEAQLDRVADVLAALRPEIGVTSRLASVVELGSRLRSPRLVQLLLDDEPPVVVAAMKRATLTDTQWCGLIARASPLARSVLRQRDDLGPEARRALDLFGPSDLSLADHRGRQSAAASPMQKSQVPPVEPLSDADGDSDQIRRIVDRIERFTSERQARSGNGAVPPAVPRDETSDIDQFSFSTDPKGVLTSVVGAPATAAIGLQIGSASTDCSYGPDGQILGAFKRRGAFRDGRLAIEHGLLRGDWLISAEPQFNQRNGRFTGYVGSARKASKLEQAPRVVEAPSTSVGLETTGNSSASMRQLIHELRTPLNGVMGFAEIIESQLLGPVNDSYRTMAGEIVGDVRRLVDILDDLDYASRDDGHRPAKESRETDLAQLLEDAITKFALDAQGRPRIHLSADSDLCFLDVAHSVAERIILHLVRALIACAGNEILTAQCRERFGNVELTIARPTSMKDLTDVQLFDPGYEHVATGPNAPVLGVGFALRLVRRLADANNGAFSAFPNHFSLVLPSGRHDMGEWHQIS